MSIDVYRIPGSQLLKNKRKGQIQFQILEYETGPDVVV